jgi:CRP/FNR family cyclic AMP-dependent transcriptional regulator
MGSSRPEYARVRLALGASAYFRDLPVATLDTLAAAAALERRPRAGLVHAAGESSDKFWLVIEGALLVSWINARGVAVPVASIGEGSYYSVTVFVSGSHAYTECRAERDTVLAVWSGGDLRALQDSDAAWRARVPRLLLQRFQATLAFYADAVSAPLEERLARRLLAQAMVTDRCESGREIELRTSQSHLARMLGASRSRLNAELRRLEKAQVVRLGYRRIWLRDCESLCRIAGDGVPML